MTDRAGIIDHRPDPLCDMHADALCLAVGTAPAVQKGPVSIPENVCGFFNRLIIRNVLPACRCAPDRGLQPGIVHEGCLCKGTAVLHPDYPARFNLEFQVIAETAAERADHITDQHTATLPELPSAHPRSVPARQ